MDYQPITHKFVAVLNKKVPLGRQLNALGHMAAGVAATNPDMVALRINDYADAEGGVHPHISDNPFIVLQADNSNQIRSLRQSAIAAGVHFSNFLGTMVEGTYAEQQDRTRLTHEAELEYYGIVLFGEIDQLNSLTKKFSLWRQ